MADPGWNDRPRQAATLLLTAESDAALLAAQFNLFSSQQPMDAAALHTAGYLRLAELAQAIGSDYSDKTAYEQLECSNGFEREVLQIGRAIAEARKVSS